MIRVATRPQPFVIVVLVVVAGVTGADPKPRVIPADTLPADLARRNPTYS